LLTRIRPTFAESSSADWKRSRRKEFNESFIRFYG
jgi:hypothetical protein